MRIPASVKSELTYSRKLFEAGVNAASVVGDSVRKEALAPEFARAARAAWVPAALGVGVGILGVCLVTKGKSGRGALVGGLLGGILGFSGGFAWGSREATSTIARQAAKNLGAVRDQHWLEKNPIAYA
ncbi:MAG: hypothetical protein WDO73_24340 [Ignavibacteriota bacterium]